MSDSVARWARGGVALAVAVGLSVSAGGTIGQAAVRHNPRIWKPKPQKVKVLPRVPLQPTPPLRRLPMVPEGKRPAATWPAAGVADVTFQGVGFRPTLPP